MDIQIGGNSVTHLVTNVSVSLNVNVTNNLHPDPLTDAVLVINENNCTGPVNIGGSGIGALPTTASCPGVGATTLAGTTAPIMAPDQRFQDPQFGTLASATRIEWNGIHFPVPGAAAEPFPTTTDCSLAVLGPSRAGPPITGCNPDITVLRVTSMRGNASQLGVPAIEGVPFSQIQAFWLSTLL